MTQSSEFPMDPSVVVVGSEKLLKTRFTPAQIDYILRKIASFCTIRQIVECFMCDFPNSGHYPTRVHNKVRYLSRNQKTCRHAKTIEKYREEFRSEPLRNYPLANRFERIKVLQRLVDEACDVRLRRVLWYPLRRNADGSTSYETIEIHEPNYQAAFRGIRMVIEELKAAGLYETNDSAIGQTHRQPVNGTLPSNSAPPREDHTPERRIAPSNGTSPKHPSQDPPPSSSAHPSRLHPGPSNGTNGNRISPDGNGNSLNKCELTASIICDTLHSVRRKT